MSTHHAMLQRAARLGLALLVVLAAACGSKGSGGGDPLKYLPTDSSMVIELNLARLRQTQFKDRLLQLRDRSESIKKAWDTLAQKSGFDPMRDLDTVAIGLPYQQQSSDMAAVLVGRFNQPGIIAWFKGREGAKVSEEKVGNHTVFIDAERNYHVCFVSPTTLLLGSKDWIRKMLELADGKAQGVRSRKDMSDLFTRLKPNQTGWLVARFPEELRKRAQEAESSFKGVTGVIAMIDFAAGMELDFRADGETDADAARITEKFNSTVKELRESPWLGALAMAPMLQDVKAVQELKVFHARATLPQQQLDDLLKKIEELVRQKMNEMPKFQFPAPEAGGPKIPSSEPVKPGPTAAEEPKAAPEPAPGPALDNMDLPKLKLSPPGAPKEKKRPGLLGP